MKIYSLLVHIPPSVADMMKDSNMKKKDCAIKCLEVLSTTRPDYWQFILEAGEYFGQHFLKV